MTGEIPRSLWPISLVFPGASEKVTLNIIFTYKNKVARTHNGYKLNRMNIFRQRVVWIFFSLSFIIDPTNLYVHFSHSVLIFVPEGLVTHNNILKTSRIIQYFKNIFKCNMVKNIFKIYKKITFLLKKNYFCKMNKIKPVWFYSLYRNYFFSKTQ